MHEEPGHEPFLNSARDAFAFLCDDFGFLLADAERRGPFGVVLAWRAGTRAVQVYSGGGAGQGVDVSCEGHEVPLETILALNRVRRRVPSPLPARDPLGVQRLADATRRYAVPWLRGDRAAFQAAREYMDVVNAWGMERATRKSPRSYKQYRQLKREWERYDYQQIMRLLDALPEPWTDAERAMYVYAKRRLREGSERPW